MSDVFIRTKLQDFEKVQAEFKKLERSVRDLNRGIVDGSKRSGVFVTQFSTKLKKLGDRSAEVATALTRNFALPIAGLGGVVLKMAGDFEQSMNQVQAVSNATGKEFDALKEQAKELGRTTQFSASEAAGGMTFLAKAGFKANEIIGAMPATLKLAAAGALPLQDAADVVSNVMAGFGQDSEDLAGSVDVLVKAFTSANTDLTQLGEAMKFAGPVANAMGQDFEQTVAMLAAMGNAGIQASMAGTSLRGALTRLANPTNKAAEIIENLGVKIFDVETAADGTTKRAMRPLLDILEDFEKAGLNAEDAMELFGQRAGPAMLALLEQGIGSVRALQAQLESAGGTAERIANVQMEGLNGALRAMKSAFEGLAIAIAESGFLEFMTSAAEGMAIMMRGMTNMSGSFTEIIGQMIMEITRFSDFLLINWLEGNDSTLATVIRFMREIRNWLLEKFKDLIDGIGKQTKRVTEFFKEMFQAVVGGSIVPDMIRGIEQEFDRLKSVMVGRTRDATLGVIDQFSSMRTGVMDQINRIRDVIKGAFSGDFGSIGSIAKTVFGADIGGLAGGIGGGGGVLGGLGGSLISGAAQAAGGSIFGGGGGGGASSLLSPLLGIGNFLQDLQVRAAVGIGNLALGAGASTDFAAGLVKNLSSPGLAAAGLLGGLGANLVFGGKGASGTGGSLGAAAGFAAGGPIGGVIGALGGGFLGSLFGGGIERQTGGATFDVKGSRLITSGSKGASPAHAVAVGREISKRINAAFDAAGLPEPSAMFAVRSVANAGDVGEALYTFFNGGFGVANNKNFSSLAAMLNEGPMFFLRQSLALGPPGTSFRNLANSSPTIDQFIQGAMALRRGTGRGPADSVHGAAPGSTPTTASAHGIRQIASALTGRTRLEEFQHGGQLIATRPRLLMVGERGAERVSIEPMAGGRNGEGLAIHFHGNTILDDFSMQDLIRNVSRGLRTRGHRFGGM